MAQAQGDPADRSAAAIEMDIGRTRAELGLTLDALTEKLAPRHLVEKGIDMISQSFGDDNGSIALDGFRANPLALALVGLGAAWLIASNTGVVDKVAQDERVRAARRRIADMTGIGATGSSPTYVGAPGVGTPGVEGGQSDRSGGWVHQAAGAARGALRAVRDTAGEYTDGPAGWLRGAGRNARDRVGDFGGQTRGILERYPLAIGAAALVVGAVVASLLPPSRVEDEWVGPTRDEVLKRAGELGRETVQRVRERIEHGPAAEAMAGDLGARP